MLSLSESQSQFQGNKIMQSPIFLEVTTHDGLRVIFRFDDFLRFEEDHSGTLNPANPKTINVVYLRDRVYPVAIRESYDEIIELLKNAQACVILT